MQKLDVLLTIYSFQKHEELTRSLEGTPGKLDALLVKNERCWVASVCSWTVVWKAKIESVFTTKGEKLVQYDDVKGQKIMAISQKCLHVDSRFD